MSEFGLFGVWVLVLGMVQCNVSPEKESLSYVDVKNLMQRVILLEKSLRMEKERNDALEEKVNSLVTNLEQTKRTFEDKYATLEKQWQKHQDSETKQSLSDAHLSIADKDQENYRDNELNKAFIDWQRLWYSSSKNHKANAGVEVREKIILPELQRRLLVQPTPDTPLPVAFYAQKSSATPKSEAGADRVIVYDIVKTNAGNGYHPSTGVFIVPESGMYVLTWSFRNGFDEYQSTQLMVNNNEEGLLHLNQATAGSTSATGIAVLHVNKGDDVYVKISSLTSHTGSVISDNWGKSFYAGWRLN